MSDSPNTLAIVRRSGFPLQIHLEEIIRQREGHEWTLLAHEHAWVAEDGRRGFADLVAGLAGWWFLDFTKVVRATMVIECKRYAGTWVFLAPSKAQTSPTTRLLASPPPGSSLGWLSKSFGPPMPESEYCIPDAGGRDDRRQLEAMGSELLSAVEAIATADQRIGAGKLEPALYIPVLVTTAALRLCVFDPASVSLKDGLLPIEGMKEDQPLKWIRFNKDLGFTSEPAPLEASRFRQQKPYQTVFVVGAEFFQEFLAITSA